MTRTTASNYTNAALCLLIAAGAFGAATALASGPIAVYTMIEKVVMEPNESRPERAQIWGAFSIRNDRDGSYSAAQRGYLYYKIDLTICRTPTIKECVPDIEQQTRAMWSDLKKKAGTGQAVGFGGSWGENVPAKVRKTSDKAESPDPFPLGNPVVALGASQSDVASKLKAALQAK